MLGAKEIKEILPHRYPFLMIDRVEEVEEGKRAKGFKNISINEEFFNGHFPDYPVMPGVLILEALAQMGLYSFKRRIQRENRFFSWSRQSKMEATSNAWG